VIDRLFRFVYRAVEGRLRTVLAILVFISLSSVFTFLYIPFDKTLEVMLPQEGEIPRTLRFLREAKFSDKVVLSFCRAGEGLEEGLFFDAVDRFTSDLDATLITGVVSDFSDIDISENLSSLIFCTAENFDEADRNTLTEKLSADAVEGALRRRYMQLLKPEGSFLSGLVRQDPLGLSNEMLKSFETISLSFGYRVQMKSGHLVSDDGRHALVVLETPIAITDGEGSSRLLSYLEGRVSALPPGVSADIVCGHTHAVGNEKTIRNDIQLTLTIAAIAFLLLFIVYFRDFSAGLIFLIPFASVLISLNISALILGKLSVFIIGLGAVVAGISVDYGIHVYVAIRKSREVSRAVFDVARPVTLGALTTSSVFVAFFFSSVAGYHELACFSIISILVALFYALFVLPHFLRAKGAPGIGEQERPVCVAGGSPGRSRITALLFFLILAVMITISCRVTFESDVAQLDGVEPHVLEAEERFRETWGGGESELAMFVVSSPDYQEAAEICDRVAEEAWAALGDDDFTSLSSFWPSRKQRKANVTRWNDFWKGERAEDLRRVIAEKGAPYSFSEDAFEPFFGSLFRTVSEEDFSRGNTIFGKLTERFVRKTDDGWQIISFFPDNARNLEEMRKIGGTEEGAFIVSRKELSRSLSDSISEEVTLISTVALVLVLVFTFLFLRSLRMSLIALVPAVTGTAGVLCSLSVLGHPLNVANLIAGIVVLGLCIDYGIFVSYSFRHGLKTGTGTAVSLSAITTLIGAGVLLFADHPALFSIGLTLVSGILAGYVSALLAVPSLCALFLHTNKEEAR
jgi:uncharacterized protein